LRDRQIDREREERDGRSVWGVVAAGGALTSQSEVKQAVTIVGY